MDRRTIEVYDANSAAWEAKRPPKASHLRFAKALGRRISTGGVRVDLGCGPGGFSAALGAPVVAVDASREMLRRVSANAPDAWPVQADLESLPFRDASLAGAWASNSYVHVPRAQLPLALADLHRALAPLAPVELRFFCGECEGEFPDDTFRGRFFALWDEGLLQGVVAGAGFVIDETRRVRKPGRDPALIVRAQRARSLADTVGADMRLLVCGLNPSLYAADRGIAFARPGNRFWPAARSAGLASRDRDPVHSLRSHGLGLTDLVKRATRRADELNPAEFSAGLERVERLVAWLRPRTLCFVGLQGWRAAVDRGARAGWQERRVGGVPTYVMPSTSGLNAHSRIEDLSAHLKRAARGIRS